MLTGCFRGGCQFTRQSCGATVVRSIYRWPTATAIDWLLLKHRSSLSWDRFGLVN